MRRTCIAACFLFFLWFGSACFGQSISVRLINMTNGHPLKKQRVSLSLVYYKGEQVPTKYDKIIDRETDIKGEAHFDLPEPPPNRLAFDIHLSSETWRGARALTESTQTVIHDGIVSGPDRKQTDVLVNKVPGEIVFTYRRLTFLERLFWPLLKG